MNFNYKALLSLLVLLTVFTQTYAQRGGGRNGNSTERAEKLTQMMVDSLALSEAQTEKITAVNLNYAKKMDEARATARNNEDFDWDAMRATMKTLRKEQSEETNKYLTGEQAEKWKVIQKAQGKQRRSKGPRGKNTKGKKDKKNKVLREENNPPNPDN